uniref:Formin homology 2 domain containing 3b n=1 Tax=Amphiprion ocellaris TaxID=80972 RepID=A0A3Q1CMM1_AMPOC
MATFICRVQFLDDTDPFNSTNFPEPTRPPLYTFREDIPLINQIAGVHRLLKAPQKADDCALQLSHNGSYLDLESTLAEQRDELEGFQEDGGIVLRTQLSVRVHACIEKLYNSTGRELRRALFSLKQIFQDDKDLVHEFVVAEGLTCLIKVGAEADQNYQNYILRALGQIMLYVDGMNGLISHNETVQWLYTLVGSKFRLVVKTSLKLLLVFVEYTECNAALLIKAVSVVDAKRGTKLWSNVMEILDEKDGVDTELLVFAMTLINKTLAGLPDQDSYYDMVDCLEEQGIEGMAQRHLSRKGTDLDLSGNVSVGAIKDISGSNFRPFQFKTMDDIKAYNSSISSNIFFHIILISLLGKEPISEPNLDPKTTTKSPAPDLIVAEPSPTLSSEPDKQQSETESLAEMEDVAETQSEKNVTTESGSDDQSGKEKEETQEEEEEEKGEEQEQGMEEVAGEEEEVEVVEVAKVIETGVEAEVDVELEEEKPTERDVEDSVLLSEKERQNEEVNEKDNCSASSISSTSSTLEREEREEKLTNEIELRIKEMDFTDLRDEDDLDILDMDNVTKSGDRIPPLPPALPPPPPLFGCPPPPPILGKMMPPPPPFMAPIPPPSPQLSRGEAPLFQKKKKTIRLFWNEVRPVDWQCKSHKFCKESLWSKLEPIKLDTSKLEQLFESKSKELPKAAVDGKRQEIIVLDSKRSNAINIGLTVLPPPRTIKTAILNFDEYALNKEGIEKILTMIPTEEEKQRIQEAQLVNPDVPLGSAEQFLLTLSSITELSARLQLWAFKMDYELIEKEVAEPLQDLKEGMDQLEKNKTLRYILTTLLAIGNFLNGSNAKGFELSYLEKVPEVKDTVHKQSLLHHACSIVVEKFPDSTDLYSEIGAITRLTKVDFDQLQDNLAQMERRCKASWDHLKVIAKHEMKPALKQKMSDFLKDCAERIIILKIVHRRIINRFHAFLLFLGHPVYAVREVSIHRFSKILSEFALEYRTTRERVLQQKQKRANHRERNKTRGKMITDVSGLQQPQIYFLHFLILIFSQLLGEDSTASPGRGPSLFKGTLIQSLCENSNLWMSLKEK